MRFEEMSDFKARGLRFQYGYTAILATLLGLVIMLFPGFFARVTGIKDQDHTFFGISGAVYTGFGLLSMLGLRQPKKFAPILLLQFTYKMIWFILVMGLRGLRGSLPLTWPNVAMLIG